MKIIRNFALTLALLLSVCVMSPAQDWSNLERYDDADDALAMGTSTVSDFSTVILGDSITDNWAKFRPAFFFANGILGRGISGQTTPQMLIRFRNDVINIKARTVVILAGTNDIAGNQGKVGLDQIMDNIASMCDIAKAHGVRPILCSVLPAHRYYWRGGQDKHPEIDIPALNAMLERYANDHRITYVNFFSAMVDTSPENFNGLLPKYSKDGVHPTVEGYQVMEQILQAYLTKEVKPFRKKTGELRLMTYNVCHCMGMDKNVDYDKVAAVISDNRPYVVALQELDSATFRVNGNVTLDQLARRTGMYGSFAPAIDFQSGKYGIGILSVDEPIRTQYVSLPGREEARALLMVELPRCVYCCMHLSLTDEDRLASAGLVTSAVSEFAAGCAQSKPVFIAGDWNDTPDSELLAAFGQNFTVLNDTASYTFPANAPDRTIDYIAVLGKGVKAESSVIPTRKASDHRPVVVVCK